MKHMQILKRAWTILWSYKALWIFGIILAFTSASYNGGTIKSGGGSSTPSFSPTPGSQLNLPPEIQQFLNQINNFFRNGITPQVEATLIAIFIGLFCLALFIGILMAIARYVSQVALMRMVDHYEQTGEKMSWKQGLRAGWSRSALRLFLIDLIIMVPVILVILVLFGCAAIPVVLGSMAGTLPTIAGVVGTIGLVFLIIFFILLVSLGLALIMEIIRRECVLEGQGVFDSIRQGWHLVIQNFKDVFLMWLILLGIRIGYSLLVIPVFIVLLVAGFLVGGGVGGALYLGVHLATSMVAAIAIAAVIGGLLLIAIISIPMLFLGGLAETYLSTTWTLVYRELAPVLSIAPSPVVDPGVA